jgi:hypothetical protein
LTYLDALTQAGLVGRNGLQGMKSKDRVCVRADAPVGSIDVDDAFRHTEAQANRWDYGIGFEVDSAHFAAWVEPHSATSSGEISVMIRKLQWMRDKLSTDEFERLRKLTSRTTDRGWRSFWWVTQGRVGFRVGTREANRIAAAGLNFPCKCAELGKK